MIKAVIFDLDGTLVQTEKLKAISYARAAVKLRPDDICEEEVVDAFKSVVGRSRQEVSLFLMQRFQVQKLAAVCGRDGLKHLLGGVRTGKAKYLRGNAGGFKYAVNPSMAVQHGAIV